MSNADEKKALDKGSLLSRIEGAISWARGRMCNTCRRGDQVCPACVRAQDAVELLQEVAVDQATKVVVSKPVLVPIEVPVAPKKIRSCDNCASGELLFDGESCEECKLTRADRKLKPTERFWEKG